MKRKLEMSTTLTIIAAILIISAAYLTVTFYSRAVAEGSLDKVEAVKTDW